MKQQLLDVDTALNMMDGALTGEVVQIVAAGLATYYPFLPITRKDWRQACNKLGYVHGCGVALALKPLLHKVICLKT